MRLISRTFSTHPFKILGIQQIALGHLDKVVLRKFWCIILGIPRVGSYYSKFDNVNQDILRIGEGENAVELHLMQPVDPRSYPNIQDNAFHHFALWVDNLEECYQYLEGQGSQMTPGGIRKNTSGLGVIFANPKVTGGILLELVQHPDYLKK
ncbi:unnamed protein product [Blepharisma stoltei]|uniref:VOC domain-containing protein n=1 Tax=Blepharisma stoltei TaxID=1481888 RepID=A0AAU9K254_9CILI|nr:unnamed protein product [Blepharisma stoltei]